MANMVTTGVIRMTALRPRRSITPLSNHSSRAINGGNLCGIVFLCLMALRASAQDPNPAQTLDLVTHNETLIAATPAKIWPFIVDPGAWKTGPRLIPSNGDPGHLGEKFKAVMPDAPEKVLFYAQNVEIEVPRRRAIRLNAPDGALIGFAIWELHPHNGSTSVAYRVYSQITLPAGAAGAATAADASAAQTNYFNSSYRRFAAELAALKLLVEGRNHSGE
jgi:hypothetical protein